MELKKINYEKLFQEKTGITFPRFYNKYYNKLVWHIKKFNITDLDAEGIANEAFMDSLEKIDMYNPEYNYSTWLFTCAKNLALQYKKQTKKLILVDTSDSSKEETGFDGMNYYLNLKIDNTNEVLDTQNISNVKYNKTLKAISTLDNKYKEFIELCDIQGKSYDEIAIIKGVSLQTVKNRLHHGRKKIESLTKKDFKNIIANA